MPRNLLWDTDKWEDLGLPFTEEALHDIPEPDYRRMKQTWTPRQQYGAHRRRKARKDKNSKKRRDEAEQKRQQQALMKVRREGEQKLQDEQRRLRREIADVELEKAQEVQAAWRDGENKLLDVEDALELKEGDNITLGGEIDLLKKEKAALEASNKTLTDQTEMLQKQATANERHTQTIQKRADTLQHNIQAMDAFRRRTDDENRRLRVDNDKLIDENRLLKSEVIGLKLRLLEKD